MVQANPERRFAEGAAPWRTWPMLLEDVGVAGVTASVVFWLPVRDDSDIPDDQKEPYSTFKFVNSKLNLVKGSINEF